MWTDSLKVGDLLIKKVHDDTPDARYGIVLEVRETNRPTYGSITVDTARQEFKIWIKSAATSRWGNSWIQDVEVRALWHKP
jgi:hypothetical protein